MIRRPGRGGDGRLGEERWAEPGAGVDVARTWPSCSAPFFFPRAQRAFRAGRHISKTNMCVQGDA